MAERKQKKNGHDLLGLDARDRFVLTEPEPIEVASGYSISVAYDEDGRPLVYVKKYGDVDTRGLRRNIERSYPGASIQGLERPRRVEVDDAQRKRPKRPRHGGRPKSKKQ